MSKKYSLFFLTLFLLVFVNAAPNVEILTPNPTIDETVVFEITTDGEFKDSLTKDSIHFYEGRKEVLLEHNIYYYRNVFYLYAIFKNAGDYTLVSDEIGYEVGGDFLSTTLDKNITIVENKGNLLQIKPGVISTASKPEVELTNKGDKELTVKYREVTLSIDAGSTRTLHLEPLLNFEMIQISTYKTFKIPMIYSSDIVVPEGETLEEETVSKVEKVGDLTSRHEKVVVDMYTNTPYYNTFELLNLNQNELTNIRVNSTIPFIFLDIPSISAAKAIINLTINSEYNTLSFSKGNVTIYYTENEDEKELIIPLMVKVLDKAILTDPEANSAHIQSKTCTELGGELCVGTCLGEWYDTIDEEVTLCCAAGVECKEDLEYNPNNKKNQSENTWVWGIVIFIIIGLIGYVVFQKYKKVGIKK